MSNARILITGGGGFVGRHVAAALVEAGMHVSVTSRTPVPPGQGIETLVCDLLAPEAATMIADLRADTLIHLAWETTHRVFWNAPANLDWAAASLRIARAFRDAGGRHLIGVGTCYEYDLSGMAPLDESTTPLMPGTLYGTAKNATHEILARYGGQCGLSLAWARLFHLYGPRETPGRLVPAAIAAIRAGEPVGTPPARLLRNFMHAEDAGRAIAALARSELTGAVNIGASENTTIDDLVMRIATALRRPDLFHPGTFAASPGEAASIVPRLARLGTLVFVPKFDLGTGIAAMIGQTAG